LPDLDVELYDLNIKFRELSSLLHHLCELLRVSWSDLSVPRGALPLLALETQMRTSALAPKLTRSALLVFGYQPPKSGFWFPKCFANKKCTALSRHSTRLHRSFFS
jgi:hypothetical protein